jgi:transcriptional regulator with XRE-family HTH domain
MDFSKRLKELRKLRCVTQKQVGEAIGSGERVIRNYEIGAREPAFSYLIALADYFDVSLDYLTGRSDDPARR